MRYISFEQTNCSTLLYLLRYLIALQPATLYSLLLCSMFAPTAQDQIHEYFSKGVV